MVNLMFYHAQRNLDTEGRSKFQEELDRSALVRHPMLTPAPPARHLRVVPDSPETLVVAPVGRWKAPLGWTPRGWSEERSYESAKQFIGWKGTVK